MDQVLFAVYSQNFVDYRAWADRLQCGLEMHAFADPAVLAGDLAGAVAMHKRQLQGFSGSLGLHGAFYDMICASLDPAIVKVTRGRFRQNLQVAAELGARYVVFHVNYMGVLKLADYRDGWHRRQVAFWRSFAGEAAAAGIQVLLENMWEDDPAVIAAILDEVGSPHVQACLDIAHATLYSDRSIAEWIGLLAPHLYCCHLNNHDDRLDVHWPLGQGIIDYEDVLARLRRLPRPPLLTLEMPDWASIAASLPYLDLPAI